MANVDSAVKTPPVLLPLIYLGLLASIQGADPNIASTALLDRKSHV